MHEVLSRTKFDKDVAALTDEMAKRLRLTVHQREYPILDVTVAHTKSLRLRFQCDDWDDIPPSIKILKDDGSAMDTQEFPAGAIFNPNQGGFVCMRGSREYHGFPGNHTTDAWSNYRGGEGMGLVGTLMQLATVWRKGVR